MGSFETIILLMFAAAILVGIAQKINLSYPIALVLGGTAIGFFPFLPIVHFDPNLILVVVLPPILHYASYGISFREFKKNWRTIFSLALGLVVCTMFVIGIIFKMIFPQFPWALAFAFGAIVSPPDAVAATAILKRFAIGSRLLTILEGESLINDATALVLYRMSITALLSGAFSISEASFEFVKVVSGGIIIGLTLGTILQRFSRSYLNPVAGVVFSFTIPYITYILADAMGVSGVLAVVVAGLIGSRVLLKHHSSQRRVIGFAVWDTFIILLNCFVFILIGLQLRTLTSEMTIQQIMQYTGYAILIVFAMTIVRMIWVYTKSCVSYVRALYSPRSAIICPQILQDAALIGWSGMRGIVSLTAALALPLTYSNGMPLEGRDEVIFISFEVILFTLLIPGFTLSSLIKWLKISPQTEQSGLYNVRKQLAKVAEEKIHQLYKSQSISQVETDFLKSYFNLQKKVLEISGSNEKELQKLESARHKVIRAQRDKLLKMWEEQELDDKLLGRLENELDVEETRMSRAEL